MEEKKVYSEKTTVKEHQDMMCGVFDDLKEVLAKGIEKGVSPIEAHGMLVNLILSVHCGGLHRLHASMAVGQEIESEIKDLFNDLFKDLGGTHVG